MIRNGIMGVLVRFSLPRMRGDDPAGASDITATLLFAPHARG